MFNFRHPKPVVDGRAVAVQVVQQKEAAKPRLILPVAATAEPAKQPEAEIERTAADKGGAAP